MARLEAHKVALASLLAIVLVGTLGYLLLVGPKRSRSSDLEQQIEETQAELTAARTTRAQQQEQPPPVTGDLSKLETAMPNRTDMPGVLLELSRVAREAGIAFDSVSPGEAVPGNAFQKVPISLVFQGNYFELSDFLFRLRSLVQLRDDRLDVDGRLFTVDGIDFGQGTQSFPNIQATLNAGVFVYGGGAPAATPPPPATPPPSEAGAP